MISVHLLTKDQVAQQLKSLGCSQSDETIEGCSCWKTRCGFHFLVPELPPDGMTGEWTLEEIIAEMEQHSQTLN